MTTEHHFTPDSYASKPGDYCCAGIGGGELCGKPKSEHKAFDLDGLRDDALKLLREMLKVEMDYHGHPAFLYPDATEKITDLGRQYVTAQAKYTNALYDWERQDDKPKDPPDRSWLESS